MKGFCLDIALDTLVTTSLCLSYVTIKVNEFIYVDFGLVKAKLKG